MIILLLQLCSVSIYAVPKVSNFEYNELHTFSEDYNTPPEGAGKLNLKGQSYPSDIDPRTGKNITMPEGDLKIVLKDQRVEWNNMTRGDYIKEWSGRGYQIPTGGWEKYDIHHILPREYEGTNAFENLVLVERTIH